MRILPVLAIFALTGCGEPDAPDFMATCKGENTPRTYFNFSAASCQCVYDKLKEHGLSDRQINLYANVLHDNQYSDAIAAHETQKKIANYVAQNYILSNCNQ